MTKENPRWNPLYIHSRNYDKHMDPSRYEEYVLEWEGRALYAEYVSSMLAKNLQRKSHNLSEVDSVKVLDVAAGTGIISRSLATRGWDVTAMDLSEKMLAYLRTRTPESGKITTVQGDMNASFEMEDNRFDGVTTVASNRFIKNPQHFLNEVRRVLKPDGVLVWPLQRGDRLRWKVMSGLRTPTLPHALASLAKDSGFIHVDLTMDEQVGTNLQYIIARK